MEIVDKQDLRAKDPRKNVSVFQEGGSTPAPPTPPVIRVVLLHTESFVESFFPNCMGMGQGYEINLAFDN